MELNWSNLKKFSLSLEGSQLRVVTAAFKPQASRSLKISLRLGHPKSHKWVVFLPGSAPQLIEAKDKDLLGLIPQANLPPHFMVINKAKDALTRSLRLSDTLKALRCIIPRHHEILLVGYSEGAYLAPSIALKIGRVRGLLLLAGGTRGWIEDELNRMPSREIVRALPEVLKIMRQDTPLRHWRGHRHDTWLSYAADTTLKDLLRLKIPVLSLIGSRDELIDRKSLLQDFMTLKAANKNNLQIKVLKGLRHDFNHRWDLVATEAKPFLRDFLTKS